MSYAYRQDAVRKRIKARMEELGFSDRDVSLKLGKSHSYMNQFFDRGSPRKLPEDARYRLAAMLGMAEHELRERFDVAYRQKGGGAGAAPRIAAEPIKADTAGARMAHLIAGLRRVVRKEYYEDDGDLDLEETYKLADALIEHFTPDALEGAMPHKKEVLRQAETLLKYKRGRGKKRR